MNTPDEYHLTFNDLTEELVDLRVAARTLTESVTQEFGTVQPCDCDAERQKVLGVVAVLDEFDALDYRKKRAVNILVLVESLREAMRWDD